MSPLLSVRDLRKTFTVRSAAHRVRVQAVRGIEFDIAAGETFGVVGESGSGKSTAARLVTGLVQPDRGSVVLDGEDLTTLRGARLRARRRDLQMVFQDPYGSLNPRMSVEGLLTEPLHVHRVGDRASRRTRAAELLDQVGLPSSALRRRPIEFSGGQRQRIAIARALALSPRLLVADEPVSALDVSVQAQVLNLLRDLQQQHGLSYLFISHDLRVVEFVSDRVAVMYLGEIVESGTVEQIYRNPRHPYTRTLFESVPDTGKPRTSAPVPPADASAVPTGCPFRARCPHALPVCETTRPSTVDLDGQRVVCHLYNEESARG